MVGKLNFSKKKGGGKGLLWELSCGPRMDLFLELETI